jgi:hypothetical protein
VDINGFNPIDYTEAAKTLGIAMMVLGAGSLIFAITRLLKKKPECNCDD